MQGISAKGKKNEKRDTAMMRCTKKYLRVFVLLLAWLVFWGGLSACSKEEIRRTLPVERSF